MAIQVEVEVKEVSISSRPSAYTDGTYEVLKIVDVFDTVYTSTLKAGSVIPSEGDIVKIMYQDVDGALGKTKHILFISILKENKEGKKTMPKITVGSSTNTGSSGDTTTRGTKEIGNIFQVKGALYYAHVREPETTGKFPSNKYKIDLSISPAHKQQLEQLGVLVKNKGDDRGDFVTMKSQFKPEVINVDGSIMDPIPKIGNGSTAIITATLYDNKAPSGGKKCLGFKSIKLTNLVEYNPPLLVDDELDGTE